MTSSFRHKGLEQFFLTGSKAGIQPAHGARLRLQLTRLDSAKNPEDINAPGWKLHSLKGEFSGSWAVWVDKNWRLVFGFKEENAADVDYVDYH
ncbi:MAG: type II toxin-antitoxin system RelE/ParE family toxin [Leptospirales bacterium]